MGSFKLDEFAVPFLLRLPNDYYAGISRIEAEVFAMQILQVWHQLFAFGNLPIFDGEGR